VVHVLLCMYPYWLNLIASIVTPLVEWRILYQFGLNNIISAKFHVLIYNEQPHSLNNDINIW
jgi:hypothetical protein